MFDWQYLAKAFKFSASKFSPSGSSCGITGKYYPQLIIYSETKVLLCSLPLPEFKLILHNGFAICPDCSAHVNCGPGGVANLEKRHHGTKICLDKRAKQNSAALKQKNGSILAFMHKKPTTVPSTVSDPPPVLNAMRHNTSG